MNRYILLLYLIFLLWSFYLINHSIFEPVKRIEHKFLAIVYPAIYVVAYYLA